jgi:hypothetical protein
MTLQSDLKSVLSVQTLQASGQTLYEGDWISLNGTTGEVVTGKQPLAPPAISGDLGTFMSWVDGCRKLKVRARPMLYLTALKMFIPNFTPFVTTSETDKKDINEFSYTQTCR